MKKDRLMELAGITEGKQKNKFDVILKHKGHPTVAINRGVDDAQAQRAKKALEELIKIGGAEASVEIKKLNESQLNEENTTQIALKLSTDDLIDVVAQHLWHDYSNDEDIDMFVVAVKQEVENLRRRK